MNRNISEQLSLFPKEKNTGLSWFAEALEALSINEIPGWPNVFGDLLIEWHTRHKTKNVNVLSLFSGAGGLDIGFHDAGFKIIECNEIEKDFAATLSLNTQPGKRLEGCGIACMDIKKYTPQLQNIDFVIGGPPCQTFSAAGARAAGVNGTDDDRGNLFKQYVRILEKVKPKGFLFENVYRIVGAQGGKPWKQIQNAFKEIGYKLNWRIIDAADYGVPQFRERLIIIGLKEGVFQFPYPTHGPDSKDNRPYYSAGMAIDGVVSKLESGKIGGRHGHLLKDIPPGLNYSFYTEKMEHPTPHFGWRSKFSDYLYKADPKTPVRTIKAQGGQYTGPFHWDSRTFTVEELKRLQTFPDNYIFNGIRQKIIHQIGNSVPPQLARILALSVAQQIFKIPLPFDLELMPDTFELNFRRRKRNLTKVYAQKAKDAIAQLYINPSKKLSIEESNSAYFELKDDIILEESEDNGNWDYYIESEVSNETVSIQLWDKTKNKDGHYQYTVKFNKDYNSASGLKLITMKSFSNDPYSITAIWKYLENRVKNIFHKDDLVQLFGYYQYSNNYSINLEFINNAFYEDLFWEVLRKISSLNIVGSILQASYLSELLGFEEEVIISQFRKLKSIGFEIRNHNTNKQIEKGYVLIPYSFPSLNERSLQRLTEL